MTRHSTLLIIGTLVVCCSVGLFMFSSVDVKTKGKTAIEISPLFSSCWRCTSLFRRPPPSPPLQQLQQHQQDNDATSPAEAVSSISCVPIQSTTARQNALLVLVDVAAEVKDNVLFSMVTSLYGDEKEAQSPLIDITVVVVTAASRDSDQNLWRVRILRGALLTHQKLDSELLRPEKDACSCGKETGRRLNCDLKRIRQVILGLRSVLRVARAASYRFLAVLDISKAKLLKCPFEEFLRKQQQHQHSHSLSVLPSASEIAQRRRDCWSSEDGADLISRVLATTKRLQVENQVQGTMRGTDPGVPSPSLLSKAWFGGTWNEVVLLVNAMTAAWSTRTISEASSTLLEKAFTTAVAVVWNHSAAGGGGHDEDVISDIATPQAPFCTNTTSHPLLVLLEGRDSCAHHDTEEQQFGGQTVAPYPSSRRAKAPAILLRPRLFSIKSKPFLFFINKSMLLSDITGDEPRNAPAVCELMLLGNPRCRIIRGEETMYDCVKRYGVHAWSAALQPQCTKSDFWKSITVELGPLDTGEYSKKYYELYDPIMRWHLAPVLAEVRRRAGVPNPPLASAMDDNGPVAQLHPPLNCSYGLVHPFGFCAPQAALVDDLVPSIKLYDWFPISPGYMPGTRKKYAPILGARPTHVTAASDELLAATLYRLSYFAWTHRRSGVDCKRHYEILAYGAVPLFPDLRWVAPPIVSHLPRALMYQAFSLPGIEHIGDLAQAEGPVNTAFYYRRGAEQVAFKGPGSINWTTFSETSYHHLAHRLYQFTSQNTVCHAMMRRALQTLGYANATVWRTLRVVVVSVGELDYQVIDVETGLVELGMSYTVNYFLPYHHNPNRSIYTIEKHRGRRNSAVGRNKTISSPPGATTVTLDHMVTGEEYGAWRQKEGLVNMYGKNYMTGRRTPMPARILAGKPLCEAIAQGEFDLVIYATQRRLAISFAARLECEAEAAELMRKRKKRGKVSALAAAVAIFDGFDEPIVMHYPRWIQNNFTVFSREARCTT